MREDRFQKHAATVPQPTCTVGYFAVLGHRSSFLFFPVLLSYQSIALFLFCLELTHKRNTHYVVMAGAQYTYTLSPLTNAFTPPASCSASWTYEAEFLNSVTGGLLLQNAETSFDTNCWPPAFTGNGRAPSYIQVYSPGVCPSGYVTAGGFTYGGTTTEICCPR